MNSEADELSGDARQRAVPAPILQEVVKADFLELRLMSFNSSSNFAHSAMRAIMAFISPFSSSYTRSFSSWLTYLSWASARHSRAAVTKISRRRSRRCSRSISSDWFAAS